MRDPVWLSFIPLAFAVVLAMIEPYTSGAAERPETPEEE